MLNVKMDRWLLLTSCVLLLAASGQCFAQQRGPGLGRFVIGSDWVMPSTRFPVPNTPSNGGTWLRYAEGAQLPGMPCDSSDIPIERWEQLRDLGLDLALVTLSHIAFRGDGVYRLRRMAQEYGILLAFNDRGIGDGAAMNSAAERNLYHAESPYTNAIPGGITTWDDEMARDPFAVSTFPFTPLTNVLRLSEAGTVASGYFINRMDSWNGGVTPFQGMLRNGGIYYLSLRLRYDLAATPPESRIPDDSTVILRLRVSDSDGAYDYPLYGCDFHTPAGVIDTVHEFLLDIFRLEQDAGSGSLQLRRGLTANPDSTVSWPGINEGARVVPEVGGHALPFELAYMPADERRPIILLDAIACSSARAFALSNPRHPMTPRRWLPTPRQYLAAFIDTLVGANGTEPPVWLQLEERLGNADRVTAMLMADQVWERSLGRTRTLLYGSAEMGHFGLSLYTEACRHSLQSVYYYPYPLLQVDMQSAAALPGEPGYYEQQYATDTWHPGVARMTAAYRAYAQLRKETGDVGEWIPAIQNHIYGFREGAPTGAAPTDLMWLREPTVRELMLEDYLHLAYGAKGLLYYVFGGTPGYDTTDATLTGVKGFLTFDHCMRGVNSYGERMWDSLRAFHNGPLRVIGDTLYPLDWIEGYSAEEHRIGILPSEFVSTVTATGNAGMDRWEESYVEASVFAHPAMGDSVRYLLLVNKRRARGEARTVHVGLRTGSAGATLWRLIDVHTGDTTMVIPPTPGPCIVSSNLVTDIAPGRAQLFRCEAVRGTPVPVPERLSIQQLFPDPVSTDVYMLCSLPANGSARVMITDFAGRSTVLQRMDTAAGDHVLRFDLSAFSSGTYILTLEAGGERVSRHLRVLH